MPESCAMRRDEVRLRSCSPATNAEKCPTPGRTTALAVGDLFGADGALGFRAKFLQGALDRGQIAGAVIDDGDFHSSPLVDGSTLRRRLSRETAKRSALANALKIDSTWWCEERPYISLRCTLAAADCAKRAEKVLEQLGLKIADFRRGKFPVADAVGAAGEVEGGGGRGNRPWA